MSETAPSRGRKGTSPTRWLSAFAALVGLWLIASPFAFASTDTGMWNNVAVGVTVFLLAGYAYYRTIGDRMASSGLMAVVAILGLWSIIAPYTFVIGSDELLWSTIAAGLLLFFLGGNMTFVGRGTRRPSVP